MGVKTSLSEADVARTSEEGIVASCSIMARKFSVEGVDVWWGWRGGWSWVCWVC